MKKNKPGFEEEAICINCVYSQRLDGLDACVCSLKGAVKADGSCKKFDLDLLKIDPDKKNFQSFQGKTAFLKIF